MPVGEPTAAEVGRQARARGARVHLVDGAALQDRVSAVAAIAETLDSSVEPVRDVDTLYDRLTDLSWLPPGEHVLIWVGSATLKEADPRGYLALRGVLSDAQRVLGAGGRRAGDRTLTVEFTEF